MQHEDNGLGTTTLNHDPEMIGVRSSSSSSIEAVVVSIVGLVAVAVTVVVSIVGLVAVAVAVVVILVV